MILSFHREQSSKKNHFTWTRTRDQIEYDSPPFSFEEGIKLALPIKPSSNNSTTPRSFHSFENLWTGSLSINHSCPRVFAFIHSPFEKLPFAYTLSYWFMNITGRFKKLVPFRGGAVPLYNDNRPWRGARVALKCPFTRMDYISLVLYFNTVTGMFKKEFQLGRIIIFNRVDLELK